MSETLRNLVSCPLAPRTESYDTRIAPMHSFSAERANSAVWTSFQLIQRFFEDRVISTPLRELCRGHRADLGLEREFLAFSGIAGVVLAAHVCKSDGLPLGCSTLGLFKMLGGGGCYLLFLKNDRRCSRFM